MSGDILLDTHIALWLDSGSPRLLQSTCALIDDRWRAGGRVFLSAVSAWEIALLVDGGRIEIDVPVEAWVSRFLGRSGVEPAPLTCQAAARAYKLRHLEHRDPADRLLIATAIELGCSLVTYDDRIQRFGKLHGSQYCFSFAD